MGKRIISRARGKGGPNYRVPSFRFYGEAKMLPLTNAPVQGKVLDLIKDPGHSAPLAQVNYDNGETSLLIAPEGLKVGDTLTAGGTEVSAGNIVSLKDVPLGTTICNIEAKPGDGGKFCRASGTTARVVEKDEKSITIELPSKKTKQFLPLCRATIGIAAGGGRTEKPMLTAGFAYHKAKAKNKRYPIIGGTSQNACDHPFGGRSSAHKGRPTQANRNAPPGRMVGKIRPRRTGMRR